MFNNKWQNTLKKGCPVNTNGLFINLSTLITASKHLHVITVLRRSLFESIYTFSTQNYVNNEIVEISHIVFKKHFN